MSGPRDGYAGTVWHIAEIIGDLVEFSPWIVIVAAIVVALALLFKKTRDSEVVR